ncbi:MAG: asparagine synthase (glutamine-hydrolyzing) [Thermoanaerobaculia bacterium]
MELRLMCGIFGGFSAAPDTFPAPLLTWNQRRGPDATRVVHSGSAFLGLCRLAVIDPLAATPPHQSEDGSILAAVNGEIYNEPELRRELEQRGYRFETRIDTEVVVHAYEEWGAPFVARLNGMFAFILWDGRRRRFLIGRDRLGIKPLFWTTHGGLLLVSSSSRSLAEGTGATLNGAALIEALYRQSIAAPRTIFADVSALPAATIMEFDGSRVVSSARYWEPALPAKTPEPRALVEQLDAAISASSARQCRTDRASAVALSGGIDSALLASSSPRPAARFVTLEGDELAAATNIAESAGASLETIRFPKDWRDAFRTWSEGADQLPADGFNTYLLCREIAGETVVLHAGIGGDELFNGYVELNGTPTFLAATAMIPAQHLSRLGAALNVDVAEVVDDITRRLAARIARSGADDRAEALRLLLVDEYLTSCLLANADDCSMAHGVELRVPLLDNELVDLAFSIPYRMMCDGRNGKIPLRNLLARRGLAAIAAAPKRGFRLPYESLVAQLDGSASLLDLVDVLPGSAAAYRRWALTAASHWLESAGLRTW